MKTLGERRVRVDFNPAGSEKDYVDAIKLRSADLIDLVDKAASNPKWDDETVKEWLRLKVLALTYYETAAMYAVKAATV